MAIMWERLVQGFYFYEWFGLEWSQSFCVSPVYENFAKASKRRHCMLSIDRPLGGFLQVSKFETKRKLNNRKKFFFLPN